MLRPHAIFTLAIAIALAAGMMAFFTATPSQRGRVAVDVVGFQSLTADRIR